MLFFQLNLCLLKSCGLYYHFVSLASIIDLAVNCFAWLNLFCSILYLLSGRILRRLKIGRVFHVRLGVF